MTPAARAIQPAWTARSGIGNPILLLAIVCAFLMPLSNPVAGGALADSAVATHVHLSVDALLDGKYIQQRIAHIATHPRAGVSFLSAFLTEAERLCQPNARQNPDIPSPNATSSLLSEASSIVLPLSLTVPWRPGPWSVGLETQRQPTSLDSPPDAPPPRSFHILK